MNRAAIPLNSMAAGALGRYDSKDCVVIDDRSLYCFDLHSWTSG